MRGDKKKLTFFLGQNKKTKEPQWQCDISADGVVTRYVPDSDSLYMPSSSQTAFQCAERRVIFRSPDGRHQVVAVNLYKPLDTITPEPKGSSEARQGRRRFDPTGFRRINNPAA